MQLPLLGKKPDEASHTRQRKTNERAKDEVASRRECWQPSRRRFLWSPLREEKFDSVLYLRSVTCPLNSFLRGFAAAW